MCIHFCEDGWGVHVMHAFIFREIYVESIHCMHIRTAFIYCKHTWFTVPSCRTLDVTLDLKDPQYPENNLGSLDLAVTLTPKEGDVKDAVRKLYKLSQYYSFISLSAHRAFTPHSGESFLFVVLALLYIISDTSGLI